MRLVWFVLAGFLLGFSISTLWEWLYFRRRRVMATSARQRRTRTGSRENQEDGLGDEPGDEHSDDQDASVQERRRRYRDESATTWGGSQASADDIDSAAEDDDFESGAHTRGAVARSGNLADSGATVDPLLELLDEDEEDADAWRTSYESPGVYLDSEDRDSDDRDAGEHADRTEPHSNIFADDDNGDDDDEEEFLAGGRALVTPENRDDDDEDEEKPVDFHVQERTTAPHTSGGKRESRTDQAAASSETPSSPADTPSRTAAARTPVARASRPATPDIYSLQSVDDPEYRELYTAQDVPAKADASNSESDAGTHDESLNETVDKTKSESGAKAVPVKPKTGTAGKSGLHKTANYPDDLAKIKGIGEVYKQRLYAAGIYTWHQIAETDEEILRSATQAYPSSNVDEWAEQAQKLAEKNGRVDAGYTGPPPNDLTTIYGIGPVGATTLYKIGICTYAQLAQLTPEDLAPHFPVAVAGDEPDFAHWIEQARTQAEELQA